MVWFKNISVGGGIRTPDLRMSQVRHYSIPYESDALTRLGHSDISIWHTLNSILMI